MSGAVIGAEIGAPAGPIGMLAGAVIGLIVMAVVVKGVSNAVQNANDQADTQLKDADTAQPCHDCGDGPDCFEPPDRTHPKNLAEFRRQLKAQQDGINDMSPGDVIKGIDKYAAEGRSGYPGEAGMRKAFREKVWNDTYDTELEESGNETIAEQKANAAVDGKAALHNPDLVAGGNPQPTDIGGASENSSLGSQWAKKGPKSNLTRAQQLKKAAEKAKTEGKQKMDVTLDEC